MPSYLYSHRQFGWVIIIAVGASVVGVALVLFLVGETPPPVAYGVLVVLLAALVNFSSLTVALDQERLLIFFGPGLVRKSFPLKDMVSCNTVTNPWAYGWGIHNTPDGWLYNVSGRQAVEIATKSGRKFRVGTDRPDELVASLSQCIGRCQNGPDPHGPRHVPRRAPPGVAGAAPS
ncbi:MAG: hypothetical protein V2A71_04790 [Candidatus Eisenbacteria bacterium]